VQGYAWQMDTQVPPLVASFVTMHNEHQRISKAGSQTRRYRARKLKHSPENFQAR
jgi:hypothetical protein